MNTQGVSDCFSEDVFVFSSSDENLENGIETIIDSDKTLFILCEELENIFKEKLCKKSIHDVEKEIFNKELTKLQNTYYNILSRIKTEIETRDEAHIVNEINTLLHYCLNLLTYLQNAISIVDSKINFECVKSLPTIACEMIFQTYNHCKSSENIYGTYLDKLGCSLTTLFKKANEVQNMFLNILNNNVMFDSSQANEISAIVIVAEQLGHIGILVTNLDIKTAADLWKQYIIFIEKHSDILISQLDIAVSINFLVSEIITSVNMLFKLERERDIKNAERNMKIASLNLKIIIKLCDIYTNNLDNCHEKLLELLIVLSGFLCPPLQVIHFNNKLIESVQVYLTAGTAPVLGHVIQDQQFVQIYFKNISSYLNNYETKLGSILLSASIMLKIIPLNSEIKNYWFGNEECNLVYKMFFFINKSHLELMLNLEINIPCLPGKPSRKSSLYEYLMLHTAAVVVNLNCKQFIYIEKILLKSILQTDVWQAMFAADIWSIASRISKMI